MRMGFSPFETRVVLGVVRSTSMAGRAHDMTLPNSELSPTVRDLALRAPAPRAGSIGGLTFSGTLCYPLGGVGGVPWQVLRE